MSDVLSVDFETRSAVDLTRSGVYVYAADPTTDVLCMCYAFDDGEVALWVPGDPVPRRVAAHVRAGGPISAWNAQFERIVWREILSPRYGFPLPKRAQFHCTAADAAALALPRKLESAAAALGLDERKDTAGHKLMMKMSRPRKPRKKETEAPDANGLYWHDSIEMRERLAAYCAQDVRTERAVGARIRRIDAAERRVYLLNQRVNDRGVRVDLELVGALRDVVDVATARANRELAELTEGEVLGVTKVPDLTRWLRAAGLDIADVTKATLRDVDLSDADARTRRVVELRRTVGKSSVAKLDAMLRATGADGRARGHLLYHAASTGREAGKLIQIQNLPRPTVKNPEHFIPRVLARDVAAIEREEPALIVVSSLLRSCLTAEPGMVLRSGDYEQIEARVVAWFAEQDDLLALFAGGGKVYETMAAYMQTRKLGRVVRPEEIANPSEERTLGKNTILGCGFQMGADTFAAQAMLQGGIFISPEDARLAVESYRSLYPRIPMFWKAINRAAIDAVRTPGKITMCGREDNLRFVVRGQFLWCILPSGRPLAYARPRVEKRIVVPKDPEKEPFETLGVSHMGIGRFNRKWTRQHLYGGKLTENVVQATARDLMMGAAQRLERAGYGEPVMTVHDEIVCETEPDLGSLEEYRALMSEIPHWARGLPVSVGCWEGERYRK